MKRNQVKPKAKRLNNKWVVYSEGIIKDSRSLNNAYSKWEEIAVFRGIIS